MTNHILIIDDDETIRIDIAQYLRNGGYEVSAAETGQEGLSILAKGGMESRTRRLFSANPRRVARGAERCIQNLRRV